MPDLKVSSDYRDEDLVITNLFFDERRPIAKPDDTDTRGMRPPFESVGVYLAMKSMSAQAGGKSIKASQRRLGKKIGRGRDFVNRWLKVLVVLNWVKVLHEGADDGETNEYLVTKPLWFRSGDDPFAPQPIVMGVVRSDRGVSAKQTGGVGSTDTGGVVNSDTKEIKPLKTLKDSADAAPLASPVISHQDAIDDYGTIRSQSPKFKDHKPYKPSPRDLQRLKLFRNGPNPATREEWRRACAKLFRSEDHKAQVNHWSLGYLCDEFSAYDSPAPAAPRPAGPKACSHNFGEQPDGSVRCNLCGLPHFTDGRPAAEDPAAIRETISQSIKSAAAGVREANGNA